MVLFILFPGFIDTDKYWEYKIDGLEKAKGPFKLKKLDFLKKLKKLGKVYTYTPKINNFKHYSINDTDGLEYYKIRSKLYKNPKKITLDDINIDKECKRIYQIIKGKDDKFIPIGHSIGSWFALHFSNLYPSRCLKVVFLEGAYIDSNNNDFKRIKNNKVKAKEINNKNIDLLVNSLLKIKKKDRFDFNKQTLKNVNKLFDITLSYYYNNIKKELNGKLKVPTLSFRNLIFNMEKGINSKDDNSYNMERIDHDNFIYKKNGDKITTYYLINSGHHPWKIQKYSDQIIDTIKKSI